MTASTPDFFCTTFNHIDMPIIPFKSLNIILAFGIGVLYIAAAQGGFEDRENFGWVKIQR